MNIEKIARAVAALTPTEKMELADRLYDLAVGEIDADPPARRRQPSNVISAGPSLEPWAGFSERRLGR